MTSTTPTAPPAASPPARRVTTPRWLDLRLVVGVVLVLAAVILGAVVVSRADRTYGVVAASHPLAAGEQLTAGDLRLVQVQLPDKGSGLYAQSLQKVVGSTLREDVASGALLPLAALAGSRPTSRFSLPFASGTAPDLHAGDRIEVWVSTAKCGSTVLLPDVAVQSVRRDDGSFGAGTGEQDAVVSVTPDLSARVATALAAEQPLLRAAVLVDRPQPGSSSDPSPLPDLGSCASAGPTG